MEQEKPYKVFRNSNGEKLVFTKEDFETIVDYFTTLKRWRDELSEDEKKSRFREHVAIRDRTFKEPVRFPPGRPSGKY